MEYIGFTTKYYTLWNVETKGEYTYYNYVQNLSMDFAKAKAKRPNALVDLSLRGHRSFKIKNTIPTDCFLFGKYKNMPIIEHIDDIDYIAWYHNNVSAENYKEKATNILINNGYKILNGKAYNENDYKRQLLLIERFPLFKEKIDNNLPFRFIPKKNLSLGYIDDNDDKEYGIINIPFCKIVFNNFEQKIYNDYKYYIPTNNYQSFNTIKGKTIVIDNYKATLIDDMTFQIIVENFHIEYK